MSASTRKARSSYCIISFKSYDRRCFQGGDTDLLGKVIENRGISPPDHVFPQEAPDLFELRLFLRIMLLSSSILFVHRSQKVLEQNKVLVSLEIVDLDVGEVGVDTKAKVGGEGVGGGGPREERCGRVIDKGE